DDVVQERRVEHRAGDGADLVEARGERDRAVTAHAAIGRLHADGARHVRRLADGSARVRAERERRLECRDGRGRAAAGSAGNTVEIPRVVGRTVGRELGRRAHRELVHVGLAERHEARGARLRDDGRVVGRHVALEDLRRRGRRHVGRDENVLHGERHTGQLVEGLARRTALIDGAGRVEGALVDVQERVNVAVDGGDAVEVGLRGLDARHVAGGEPGGEFCGGKLDQVVHHCSSPRIAVTRKRDPSWSGAFFSASSVESMSPGTSSRNTFTSGMGWLVATTSLVATSLTSAMLDTMASSSPVRLVTSSSDSWILASTPRWRTRSGVISDTRPVYAAAPVPSGHRRAPSGPSTWASFGRPQWPHGGSMRGPYGPREAGPAYLISRVLM